MLLEQLVPEPQFRERHHSYVAASPEQVYQALENVDFARSATIRILFEIRGLGRRLRQGGRPLHIRWEDMVRIGFIRLAEQPGKELVIGAVAGPQRVTDAAGFRGLAGPGWVKIAMNWTVEPAGAGTLVATETRIRATDPARRRRFRAYWMIIRPFSGLIRRRMLTVLRTEVHKAQARPAAG